MGHTETTEWVNLILERFWTVFEPVMSAKVIENVNMVLQEKKPGFLESLVLKEFTLGSNAPAVLGARAYPETLPNVIHLDMDLCFYPLELSEESKQVIIKMRPSWMSQEQETVQWNSKIVLVARIGKGFVGVDVPVMIKELSFSGKLRVQIELMGNMPLLKQVQLTFMEPPKIDFILKPLKAFDLMDLPGLSNWLMGTINDQLEAQLVNPNKITINIAGTIEKIKTGVLKIKIMGTQGITWPASSEPFIKVELNGKLRGKTAPARNTDEDIRGKFYILTKSLDKPLRFVIIPKSGSEPLGAANFNLDATALMEGDPREERSANVLDDKGDLIGTVRFQIAYSTAEDILDPEADLSSETGVFSVCIKKGTNLLPVGKPASDVYVEAWVHPKKVGIDPSTHIYTEGDHNCHRFGQVQAVPNEPVIWGEEDEWEVYLDHVSRTQVTLMVKDVATDEVYCFWTSPVKKLLNRADRFRMADTDGMVDLAFGFKPTSEGTGGSQDDLVVSAEPAIGALRLRILGATELPEKSSYYVVVERGEGIEEIGRTGRSLEGGAPAWNKAFTCLVHSEVETFGIDLYSKDLFKDALVGGLDFPLGHLLDHPNELISQEVTLRDRKGRLVGDSGAKIRYEVGFFPAIVGPERTVVLDGNDAYPILPEDRKPECNAAILEVTQMSVRGLGLGHQEKNLYLELALDDPDEPLLKTPKGAKQHLEGAFIWRCHAEAMVRNQGGGTGEGAWGDIVVSLKESKTIGSDEVIETWRLGVAETQAKTWIPRKGSKVELRLEANVKPLELILPTEAQNVGTLTVQLIDAEDLLAVDDGGTSDPFAVFRLNTTKAYKSQVIKKELNPVWNESFELDVKHRDRDILYVELRDWNRVALSRTLGQVSIDLAGLTVGEWQEMVLPLENVSTGRVHLKIRFTPSSAMGKAKNVIVGAPAAVVSGVASGVTGVASGAKAGAKAVFSPLTNLGKKDKDKDQTSIDEDNEKEKDKEKGRVGSFFSSVGDTLTGGKKKSESKESVAIAAVQHAKEEEEEGEDFSLRFIEVKVNGASKAFDIRLKARHGDKTIFKTDELRGVHTVADFGKEPAFLIPSEATGLNPLRVQLLWGLKSDPEEPELIFNPEAMEVLEEHDDSVLASLPFPMKGDLRAELIFKFGEASAELVKKAKGGSKNVFSSLKGAVKL